LVSRDCNRQLSADSFAYYSCGACGLFFLDPVPAELSKYYAGGYQAIPADLGELRAIARLERYRLEPVLRHKSGGDLLEIGPWIGVFSINAKDQGFNVDAVEMSPAAAEFLRDVVGVGVLESDDPATALERPKQYDVITFWHSLEHLRLPWEALRAAARRLKPGGIVLVAIPNVDSDQFRAMGERWLHLDAPRHLYFWPPEALQKLASACGLTTLEISTDDKLSKVLERNAWVHYVRQKMPVPILGGMMGRIVGPLASWVSSRGQPHRGAGITALFTRT
jgi:2-polyprenyl-3-methyl-5-hydroxy-6-metoxy-1,4-benzoquinol methylase